MIRGLGINDMKLSGCSYERTSKVEVDVANGEGCTTSGT